MMKNTTKVLFETITTKNIDCTSSWNRQ